MTSQERDQLNHLLQQLKQINLTSKDEQASQLIQEATQNTPDACYLLIQRALLLEQALNTAKQQINNLENQLANVPKSGFLNNDPWSQPTSSFGTMNAQSPRMTPPLSYPAQGASSASSFLGNVATTAAGVVAGSFLFQGIEHLLGHSSSFHPYPNDVYPPSMNEPTVINNYYGDDAIREASMTNEYATEDNNDNSSFLDDSDLDSDWI